MWLPLLSFNVMSNTCTPTPTSFNHKKRCPEEPNIKTSCLYPSTAGYLVKILRSWHPHISMIQIRQQCRKFHSWLWLLCLNLAQYLGPCDWPLWRWWLCWWLSGESRSPLPPWVKNGRCSAACGEWRHPTLACSMHTTGKHHREEIAEEEEEEEERGRKSHKWWLWGGERDEREKGETHRRVMRIPWQTQSHLLAVNSEAGWVMKETHREIIV